jgi:hypothetical protein
VLLKLCGLKHGTPARLNTSRDTVRIGPVPFQWSFDKPLELARISQLFHNPLAAGPKSAPSIFAS